MAATSADGRPSALILAPLGTDAEALRGEVEALGFPAVTCPDTRSFIDRIEGGDADAILFAVISHEGATAAVGRALQRVFDTEPVWSRLPVLFLISGIKGPPPACTQLGRAENAPPFLLFERPVSRPVLGRALGIMAEDRQRQYRTRDLLDRLAEGERRQNFLLRELRHRIGNSLAVMQALFSQTAARAQDRDELVAAFSQRLGAFADAHVALTREGGDARSLSSLIRDQVSPYCQPPERLALEGPAVILAGAPSFDLAMVVHELATNAAKYGALSNDAGQVHVSWRKEPESGGLAITWTETGGPPVEPPARNGLGSTLIAHYGADGGRGKLEYRRSGVVCRLALSADAYELEAERHGPEGTRR